MTIWRDDLEVAHMMFGHGLMFGVKEGVQSALAEHLIMTGAYQTLKWAMEYASWGLYRGRRFIAMHRLQNTSGNGTGKNDRR
jgi:hypothetical protein